MFITDENFKISNLQSAGDRESVDTESIIFSLTLAATL